MASDFSIDVAQHRVCAEGAHAGLVDRFSICFESGLHHGLRGVPVSYVDALSKTIVERIVQIKDHAADERLRGLSHLPFSSAWTRLEFSLLFFLSSQRHLSA